MSTRVWGSVGARAIAPQRRFTWAPANVPKACVTATVWLSSAIVVATFFASGGTRRLDGLGPSLTSLGAIAGLVATNLMLLMFLAVARIPAVDAFVGHALAMRLHRKLGPWVFWLVLVHFALVIAGGAASSKTSFFAELGENLGQRDMVLAFIALVSLVAVVATSIVIVRRKLPREAWHVVHLATYAALVFAIPHQFSAGRSMSQGAAKVYWVALISLTLIALLTFRVFVPLLTSWRQGMRVVDVEHISRDTMHIYIRGKRFSDLDLRGGQWANWRFLQGGLWWHAHPFSLAGAPRGDVLRLTVKTVGDGTDRLRDLEPGTKVMVEGPYGRFTSSSANTRNAVFIGAGSGMTAVRGLLDEAEEFSRIVVIQRAADSRELLYSSETRNISQLLRSSYFEIVGPRGRGWMSRQYDHVRLHQLAPWVARADVYICGPKEWTEKVVESAIASGVDPENIHVERFEL